MTNIDMKYVKYLNKKLKEYENCLNLLENDNIIEIFLSEKSKNEDLIKKSSIMLYDINKDDSIRNTIKSELYNYYKSKHMYIEKELDKYLDKHKQEYTFKVMKEVSCMITVKGINVNEAMKELEKEIKNIPESEFKDNEEDYSFILVGDGDKNNEA